MIAFLLNLVSDLGYQEVIGLGLFLVGFVTSLCWLHVASKEDDTLERHLGVRPTYTWQGLPEAKIDVYCETKETLRVKHAPDYPEGDDTWMAALPPQEKDLLKYYLMQRAIGDMAALRKIDADARGYWKLFSKGIVTQRFWNSVVEVEHEVSDEIEEVKLEASSIEPNQDPQGIISEAMQWLYRFGDKLPPDPSPGANPLEALLSGNPAAAAGLKNGLAGVPGMPPMPPGMGPPFPGADGPGPPGEAVGSECDENGDTDADESYKWTQDNEEVEVTIAVKQEAKKNEIRVVFKVQQLRVELAGEVVCEGKLASRCEPESSTWTLSKGKIICSLAKADTRPWPRLFMKSK